MGKRALVTGQSVICYPYAGLPSHSKLPGTVHPLTQLCLPLVATADRVRILYLALHEE